MNSGIVNGAEGLSERTDAIHTSRAGSMNGSARNKTAFTTENTAMFAPIARARVEMTANAKLGWRRNCRIETKKSFHSAFILENMLNEVSMAISGTNAPKSAIRLASLIDAAA